MTTKWFDVIQLDGWLYVVDKESNVNNGDYTIDSHFGKYLPPTRIHAFKEYMNDKPRLSFKVIASNNPALEGVAKLPEIGRSLHIETVLEGEQFLLEEYPGREAASLTASCALDAFIKGYKAASKLYTEEDMKAVAWDSYLFAGLQQSGESWTDWYNKRLQSLKPVISQVELETNERKCMEERCLTHVCDGKCKLPKIIDNYVQIVNTK